MFYRRILTTSLDNLYEEDDPAQRAVLTARRGAQIALRGLAKSAAEQLPEKLPSLWSIITTGLPVLLQGSKLS